VADVTKPAWWFYRGVNIALKTGRVEIDEMNEFWLCREFKTTPEQLDLMAEETVQEWSIIISRMNRYGVHW